VTGTLLTLVAVTGGVYVAGSLILRTAPLLGASALPYLTDELLLRSFTIFGRFPDFALGTAAGLLFLSGRVEGAWHRRNGRLLATVTAAGAAVLLVAAQAGMVRDEADPMAKWRWDLLVAIASVMLVLALTCRPAPLSRLLSLRPAVYLGRISYALYLIQLGPLGNHLVYRLAPGHQGVHFLVLYLGMSLVAALLFEVVEEPVRETVLALWRKRSLVSPASVETRRRRVLSILLLVGALATQHALWALGSLPPVDEARVRQVLGPDSPDVLRATPQAASVEGRSPRVRLPVSWRRGPIGDLRAPRSLLVFADERPVPFVGTGTATSEAYAYYRHGRAYDLSLQMAVPARVTVVNHAPGVALALTWSRLVEAPVALMAPLLLLGAAGLVSLSRRSEVWTPRASLSVAVALVTSWVVSGIHLQRWAPLVLMLELAGLLGLVLSRRMAAPRASPMALEAQPLGTRPDCG